MKESTKLLETIKQEKPMEAKKIFSTAVWDKVSKIISEKKRETARTLFNK